MISSFPLPSTCNRTYQQPVQDQTVIFHCISNLLLSVGSSSNTQGRREEGAEGADCPRASGSRGPHQLISKFLFRVSSDVLKEPLNRSTYKVLCVPTDSVPQDSLAFCPFCLQRSYTEGPHFAILPTGLESLSETLVTHGIFSLEYQVWLCDRNSAFPWSELSQAPFCQR